MKDVMNHYSEGRGASLEGQFHEPLPGDGGTGSQ